MTRIIAEKTTMEDTEEGEEFSYGYRGLTRMKSTWAGGAYDGWDYVKNGGTG